MTAVFVGFAGVADRRQVVDRFVRPKANVAAPAALALMALLVSRPGTLREPSPFLTASPIGYAPCPM
jgi:hypothetical protein